MERIKYFEGEKIKDLICSGLAFLSLQPKSSKRQHFMLTELKTKGIYKTSSKEKRKLDNETSASEVTTHFSSGKNNN